MSALQQTVDAIRGLIHDHWTKFLTGLAFTAAGWFLGRFRARGEWKRKQFYDRLNVSLNILRSGEPLRIRTLIEAKCETVFGNKVAIERLIAAARRTSAKKPLLTLPHGDYWYYLNSVLNLIAEKFADGQIKRDLGQPVVVGRYLICLTCEAAGAARTRKVRAMVIQKETLKALPETPPAFETPWHSNRWDTLKMLTAEYARNPDVFLEMDIAV